MRVAVVLLLVLLVLSLGGARAQSPQRPEFAVGRLVGSGSVCTAVVIRPRLAFTASHCVGQLGTVSTIQLSTDGQTFTNVEATNVWDSKLTQDWTDRTLDLSFLALKDPWQYTLPFRAEVPQPNQYVLSISSSLGIYWWIRGLKVEGLYDVAGLGKVIVYRGDIYGGASGSAVLMSGEIVGMITHGLITANPPIMLGAHAQRILDALAHYDGRR